jgi:hypothetical protein
MLSIVPLGDGSLNGKTVTFYNGINVIGTGTCDANGKATLKAALPVGDYFITAKFAGDANLVEYTSVGFPYTVEADPPAAPSTSYYITATVDERSIISPSGKVSVEKGGSKTFTFSAKSGFKVVAVFVDGVAIPKDQMDQGYYTFSNVTAIHTIEVKSTASRNDITMRVDIVEGKGYVEYRVNSDKEEDFVKYTGVAYLPEHCKLEIRAVAADGYKFSKWMDYDIAINDPLIPFDDLLGSIDIDLYFEKDSGSDILLWVAGFLLLLLLLFLIILLLRRRKKEEEGA